MAPFTTLGVGGCARFMIAATEENQLVEALAFARSGNWPVFVLGGGSNILVSDTGFPGLVIRICLSGIRIEEHARAAVVTAAAGEDWDPLVGSCVGRNFAGIECLSGIPGTVGGTPIQNVGAYGQEVSEVITKVRVLNRATLCFEEFDNETCGFSYRSSIFNGSQRERYIVSGVTYTLRPGGDPRVRYADLQRIFAGRNSGISLAEVRDAVLKVRISKAMVLAPGDPDSKSAGSFFKNPVVNEEAANRVEERARMRGELAGSESLPRYKAPGGMFKLPAAWLIERAGFRRGYSRGQAGLSSKHTLALINRGDARASDILDLMHEIQSGVRASFGIDLTPEPVFVGF